MIGAHVRGTLKMLIIWDIKGALAHVPCAINWLRIIK